MLIECRLASPTGVPAGSIVTWSRLGIGFGLGLGFGFGFGLGLGLGFGFGLAGSIVTER